MSINLRDYSTESINEIEERSSMLRELTYEYQDLQSGKSFNKTLFTDYTASNRDFVSEINKSSDDKKNKVFIVIRELVGDKLAQDIKEVTEFKDSSECDNAKKVQLEILIASLSYTQEALDFELEKAGFEHGLNEVEIQEKIEKLEKYDSIIFGEHVSENQDFLEETYSYLQYLISNHGSKIGDDEKNTIESGLKKIGDKIISLSGDHEALHSIKAFKPEIDTELDGLKEITLSREEYIQLFDEFYAVSQVPQRSQLGDFGSFTDGDDFYGIPSNDSYATKTLKELVLLAPHEAGHYINLGVTRDRRDGKHRGDMIKEEGLAKFTEKIISGISIDTMNSVTFGAPSVVLSRLLGGGEYKNFMDAYGSLLQAAGIHSKKRDTKKEFLRKKRGFSENYTGGSNKDASYSLGLFSVLQYIRNGNGGIENLFGGKISMQGVESGNFAPDDFGNKHISHILFSEIIIYYLKNDRKIIHKDFVTYLKNKYKYFSNSFELFNEAEKFTRKNRIKVKKILNIVDQATEKRDK